MNCPTGAREAGLGHDSARRFAGVRPAGRVTFSAMRKSPKNRRGTAQDERFALIFAHPTPSGPSGHLPLTGGVGPGPHYGGTPSWEVVYHFRRANSEWPSKFPPGHWALGLQKLGLVQFRSCAWRCPANIPGTNPGGPVWDRPLREQHSRSYIRRRGGSKTRPQNLPLGEGRFPLSGGNG